MYILSMAAMTMVALHCELSTMHGPWLSHCKSSWSCMNCKMSSKHLYIEHADVPYAAAKWQSTTWSEESPLRDERYVKKLSNLLCLTRCGFYDCLDVGGSVCPNMSIYCRAHGTCWLPFSNIAAVRTKTEKLLQEFSLCSSALPMLFSKRCLWSCMVGLIQIP